jgi:hypothetical protein
LKFHPVDTLTTGVLLAETGLFLSGTGVSIWKEKRKYLNMLTRVGGFDSY